MNIIFRTIIAFLAFFVFISCQDRDVYPRKFRREEWIELQIDTIRYEPYREAIFNDTHGYVHLPNHLYSVKQVEDYYCQRLFSFVDWNKHDVIFYHYPMNGGYYATNCNGRLWINPTRKQYFIELNMEMKPTLNTPVGIVGNEGYTATLVVPNIPADYKEVK